MTGTIRLDTREWYNTGYPTQDGSQSYDDANNDVKLAIQALNDALNAVGFMQNAKNFITVMEEFGQGMEAALACVSLDLAVVASGVKAAATAFAHLDSQLGSLFTQMDQQLTYFTNTASSITLATPTAAEQQALLSLLGSGTPNSYDPGITLTPPDSKALAEGAGIGVVGGVLLFLGFLAFA